MLALFSSIPFELSLILLLLKNRRSYNVAGKTAIKGTFSGMPIVLVHTGIGKVNALYRATGILEKLLEPDC
jgi:nucleoside phosphorylase